MSLKKGLIATKNYSPNFDLQKRDNKSIKYIIIHYTGMKKESNAIKRLCDPKSKVSSHFFIKNSGEVINLVPELYTAWHAGKSEWKGLKLLNKYSIGIEINNPGHDHGYKKFSTKQIFSLIKLLRYLTKKFKIKKKNILGHSDIAPNRKKAPGEKFPWKKLASHNLCNWHNLSERKLKKLRAINNLEYYEEREFFENLSIIGYLKLRNNKHKIEKKNLISAFQRKFRQNLINGKIDQECLLISRKMSK